MCGFEGEKEEKEESVVTEDAKHPTLGGNDC